MWTFQYKNGDRPLEGFTIQHAAGRGGFGEVYYAVSDSGREVALKAVQGYEQIELRGISQCMNLKSPHLVTIFDVKYNDLGKPFVIMEFVAGPSLRQLLDESPAGLGTQKAAFFLREIGKGLTFLHECGIVHRDLKPGNIFFENGYVKIGDYGLSKAISPTQHSGQTVTVGTVHYMAPEIGAGKYDRSIDIYAMGAVLYEMLTGTVPFIGASPSEILMKHLSAEPDLSGVPEPFAAVVKKAMAKNPADRYASVQEMVEAVFGTEHVRMSVSHFSPDDLSMVAARVAEKVAVVGAGGGGGGSSSVIGGANDPAARMRERMAGVNSNFNARVNEAGDRFRAAGDRLRSLGEGLFGDRPGGDPKADTKQRPAWMNDPLPLRSRLLLGVLTAVVVAIAGGAILGWRSSNAWGLFPAVPLFIFLAIGSAAAALMISWSFVVTHNLRNESQFVQRLTVAGMVSAGMMVLAGPIWMGMPSWFHGETWVAIIGPLVFLDTFEWCRANRQERVELGPAIGVGFIGMVLTWIFGGESMLAAAVLAGTALVVQVVAPWDPTLAKAPKSRRQRKAWLAAQNAAAGAGGVFDQAFQPFANARGQNGPAVYGNVTVDAKEAEAMRAAGTRVYGNVTVRSGPPPFPTPYPTVPSVEPLSRAYSFAADYRPVPRGAKYIWLGLLIVSLTVGLMCLIALAVNTFDDSDAATCLAFGMAGCVGTLFCFIRIFTKRFYGPWSYFIRPTAMVLCVNAILMSSIMLCNISGLEDEDRMLGIFFIVLPSILLIVLPFLPRRFGSQVKQRTETFTAPPVTPRIAAAAVAAETDAKSPADPAAAPVDGQAPAGAEAAVAPAAAPYWQQPASFNPPPLNPLPSSPPLLNLHLRLSGGLFAFISSVLLVATLATVAAIRLDAPEAVSNGLPNADTKEVVTGEVFQNDANWENLSRQLMVTAASLLAVGSLATMIVARRGTSLFHVIRGFLGVGGLILAICVITAKFKPAPVWSAVAGSLKASQNPQAAAAFVNAFQHNLVFTGAGIGLVSLMLLTMAYRRRDANKGTI